MNNFDVFSNKFSYDIFKQKYSMDGQETWADTCKRVVENVCGSYLSEEKKFKLYELMHQRKFIPGGRYLYSAGRPFKQISNCFLFRAEDSREGWANAMYQATLSLMTGGGIGFNYNKLRGKGEKIYKTGGTSTGPLALMHMINESGRFIMQGGTRRCLAWHTKITMADGTRKEIKDINIGDLVQTRYGIKKVINKFDQGIQDTFVIQTEYGESVMSTANHKWLGADLARNKKWIATKDLKVGGKLYYYPFFYNDTNKKDMNKDFAYMLGFYIGNGCAYSSNRTHEITFQIANKHQKPKQIQLLCSVMKQLDANPIVRNGHGKCLEIRCRSKKLIKEFKKYKEPHKEPNIQFIYEYNNSTLCAFLAGWFDADGSYTKDAWRLSNKHKNTRNHLKYLFGTLGFLTSEHNIDIRINSYQKKYFMETIGKFTFKKPTDKYNNTSEIPAMITDIFKWKKTRTYDIEIEDVNEFIAENFVSHNSAIYASLLWSHPDIFDFLELKNWSKELRDLKEKDLNFHLPMELTNISVDYDTEFFVAINDKKHLKHEHAKKVWKQNCKQAFKTAEPGFMFNFLKDNENLRNACVTGDTKVLTKNGLYRIDSIVELLDCPVSFVKGYEIWNGKEWSEVRPKITGYYQRIVEVALVDGRSLKCTLDHEWLIEKEGQISVKQTKDLQRLDRVVEFTDPNGKVVQSSIIETINDKGIASEVYCFNEPKLHQGVFNGILTKQCTEVVSEDDSDKCNLGTLWLNRFETKEEFEQSVGLASEFLICGNLYTDVPFDKIKEVGLKNNRIGLGLGGIHEWLIQRGYKYEVVPELHKWLNIYEQASDSASYLFSKEMNLPVPKGKRAIAPTGTIGILAETTTGIEPLFCKAYKRRYLKGDKWHYQYVVDGMIKRLLDKNIDIKNIQDSYDLSFQERVKFQADVQQYVDMGISSTCNIPSWGTDNNNEKTVSKYSKILLKYAKRLRGFTVFPDGARGGQPLTRVSLDDALKQEGKVFEEKEHECLGGSCGI